MLSGLTKPKGNNKPRIRMSTGKASPLIMPPALNINQTGGSFERFGF